MFEPLFDALGSVMNLFYSVVPSYGVAIMGLTVLVMVLITPLTVKSTRSMLQMQRLQPEMKRIQEKYKNDRERLNQELMAFYKENKINPLGGCLPLLAQMPVFFIMYELMRGLTTRVGGLGSGLGHIAGQVSQGKALTPWVFTDQVFRPKHLNVDTQMYEALSKTSKMNFLGMDLALSPSQALKISLLVALPFLALLAVMLLTGIVQNRQLQARNTSASVNPQQQMIMKFMPFFLPVISFTLPAGLGLYWCTQNLCRIATNQYITRSIYQDSHADAPIEARSLEKPSSGSSAKKSGAIEGANGSNQNKSKPDTSKNRTSRKGLGSSKATGPKPNAAKSTKSKQDGASSEPSAPGKSVRSQKAREKASGNGSTRSEGTSGSRRRSGERRSDTRKKG